MQRRHAAHLVELGWSTGSDRPYRPSRSSGPAGPSGTAGIFGTDNNGASEGEGAGASCTLGEVTLTAAVIYADNWSPAKGQTLPISENTALFDLIGTNYGGNGTTNFELPNLTAAAPNGLTYLICVAGVFP